MILYYFNIILLLILMFIKSKKYMHMLQQNLYNEHNRYVSWLIKNKKIFINFEILNIIFILINCFIFNNNSLILMILLILINIYSFISIDFKMRNEVAKIPFKITKRVERLYITFFIVTLLSSLLLYVNTDIFVLNIYITLLVFFTPIVLYIINLINVPVEKFVYKHFYNKAKNKLKGIYELDVIGITGSYGKTSSKKILNDILNIKYNSLTTPKNLNTPYGLMITIDKHLNKFHNKFIAEMGACRRGSIKRLCDFVEPKYGILTNIGLAHLETFGSKENIIKGKFELIESLPSDGLAILNRDDVNQVNYKLKNKVRTIWIGIDNKDADFIATNIKYNNEGTSFDLKIKGDKKSHKFSTKLLGVHNVYNILASIALGYNLNISMEDLIKAVKKVVPVEHRLELKRHSNFYFIDDAYNSNPVGSSNALDILNSMKGLKVVVTPGMVELGSEADKYNGLFGEKIASVADYVILVGEKNTRAILKGLNKKKYDKDKIFIIEDVKKAFGMIEGWAVNKEVYALFENDLPDLYNK